jgi:polyisoprenoid-binding protein YceI
MKTKFLFVKLLLTLLIYQQALAQTSKKIVADKKTSTLEYYMKHPMHDWTATCRNFNAAIVFNSDKKLIEQIAVVARADAFDSGNGNRDSHAVEAIEALRYPTITFKSTEILKQDQNTIQAEGFLTFHGITQKIKFTAKKKLDTQLIIEGDFVVKLSDYRVERPSLLGIKAENELKINFKTSFII